jgi:hypothetical protein
VPVSSTVVVYTVSPAEKGRFIFTQVWVGGVGYAYMQLDGSVIGPIPLENSGRCTQYVPGIAIKPEEALSCTDSNGSYAGACLITKEDRSHEEKS